jgi:hypothetical protein
LYSYPNIIRHINSRRMRCVGHVVHMREDRTVCKVLVGKPEGKRPIIRARHRWGIRIDHRDMGWGDGVDSVGSG